MAASDNPPKFRQVLLKISSKWRPYKWWLHKFGHPCVLKIWSKWQNFCSYAKDLNKWSHFWKKKGLRKKIIPAKKWDNKYHAQLKTFSTIVSIWTSRNYEKQCNANVKILGSSLGTGLDDYLATETSHDIITLRSKYLSYAYITLQHVTVVVSSSIEPLLNYCTSATHTLTRLNFCRIQHSLFIQGFPTNKLVSLIPKSPQFLIFGLCSVSKPCCMITTNFYSIT